MDNGNRPKENKMNIKSGESSELVGAGESGEATEPSEAKAIENATESSEAKATKNAGESGEATESSEAKATKNAGESGEAFKSGESSELVEAGEASAINATGDGTKCISKDNKTKRAKLTLYIILIASFIGALVYLGIRFGSEITELAREPESLGRLLNSYGWKGVFVFIGIQILQVVVAAIPGEFVQIAGGYIYGTWLGTLYSLTGIVLGSVLVFFTARLLGYPVVRLFVSSKQLEKYNFMINSKKSDAAMFVLFLIPGIPKDVLTYIAGITPVKPLKFFIIITIGRLPALLASSYIGSSTEKGNYVIVIILSVAAIILFVTGILLKDRIINIVHKITGNDSESGKQQ